MIYLNDGVYLFWRWKGSHQEGSFKEGEMAIRMVDINNSDALGI